MSHFVTRNNLDVSCVEPTCICNAAPKPVTPAAVQAADEERWWDDLLDLMQDYLRKDVAHRDCPKSEDSWREAEAHEAKRSIIDRFFASGYASGLAS